MAENSKIEWCDHTFNPWIGCTKISDACTGCYAEALAQRYGWVKWGHGEARRMAAPSTWKHPKKWDKAAAAAGVRKRVFCASLADVFDAEVDDEWRVLLFEEILATPNLDWLLLTKRPQVAKKWFDATPAPCNVWLGTTVENQAMADLRIPILLSTDVRVRFLSCEPLLGPIDLTNLDHTGAQRKSEAHGISAIWTNNAIGRPSLDWIIAGGESGPGARPMHPDWARSLRDQCARVGVAFFFKQWGEWAATGSVPDRLCDAHLWPMENHRCPVSYRVGKKAAGATLDGREHREWPQLQQRETQ